MNYPLPKSQGKGSSKPEMEKFWRKEVLKVDQICMANFYITKDGSILHGQSYRPTIALAERYPIPFRNDRAISAGVGNFAPFCTKLVTMATSLKIPEKEGRIGHLQFNIYHMVQRLRKSVQPILRYFGHIDHIDHIALPTEFNYQATSVG